MLETDGGWTLGNLMLRQRHKLSVTPTVSTNYYTNIFFILRFLYHITNTDLATDNNPVSMDDVSSSNYPSPLCKPD